MRSFEIRSISSGAASAVRASSTSASVAIPQVYALEARRAAAATDSYNREMAKTVAVIGASSNRHKYGNKALRAFAQQGYTVLAINPNEREVEGYRTYPSVLDVPGSIDMATLYVQ